MDRRDLLIAILAASGGRPYEPVQIQKATFLVARNLGGLVDEGASYAFVPYDYGPFDMSVYTDAERLEREGLAVISPSPTGRWRTYAASAAGIERGRRVLASLDEDAGTYIADVSGWVRGQTFGGLVRAIYDAYPEMRANSVFQDQRR